jgi:hypothetical protein
MGKSKQKIDEIANEHIELGMLLRRKRRKKEGEAVDKIMESGIPIQEKILAIKKIDSETMSGETDAPLSTSEFTMSFEVEKNQERIKARVKKNGLFNFIFLDSIRIKKFGRESHVLTSGLLPFNVRANPEIRRFFNTYFQKHANDLAEPLRLALSTGWQYLKKTEYNLLVVLKRFCDEVLTTNFIILNYRNRNLIDKLQPLERLFLILHSDPEYIATLCASVKAVLLYNNGKEEEQIASVALVQKLLTQDGTLPSFYNFILGLNMIKYRKFLNIRQIVRREKDAVLLTSDFDCDPEVKLKIKKYVQGVETSLLPLLEQNAELVQVKTYTSREETGETDFTPLSFFYDAVNRDTNSTFSHDKENVVLMSANFLKGFMGNYKDLLNGKVPIADNKSVEIFSQTFFKTEIIRLEYYLKKLAQLMLDFGDLPIKRFVMIKTSQRGALDAESEAIHIADEISMLFGETGRKLAQVLKSAGDPQSLSVDDAPLTPSMLEGGPVAIPYGRETVFNSQSQVINGKSITENLKQAARLSFLSGLYLNNEHITYLVRNEKTIRDSIKTKMEILERVASADAFREFRKMHKI